MGGAMTRLLNADANGGTPHSNAHASFPVARALGSGCLDTLQVDECGLVRLEGWSREAVPTDGYPAVSIDGQNIPLLQHFRFRRPDVPPAAGSQSVQTGVAWEYLIPEAVTGPSHAVELRLPEGDALAFQANVRFVPPHYRILFGSNRVYHREEIYGSGPPNRVVHADVWELARLLEGPVLDFGCGRGALVSGLGEAGIEAHGLELDSPLLRSAISPALAGRITLYDGSLPAPFADRSFRSVICSEVLEHIPDYRAAVADIARIATHRAIFTVPDASAIPVGYRHGIVPWHLLEGTHLNFFCQQSLQELLAPHFQTIEFGRAGSLAINDSSFYVSLTAVCSK